MISSHRRSVQVKSRTRGHRACFDAVNCLEAMERRVLLSASPPPLGPEFLVPGDTEVALSVGQQTNMSLSEGPDGVSLAVWQDTRSGGHPQIYFGTGLGTMTDIYAARVDAAGNLLDTTPIPVAINSYNQEKPKAAWNGTNWLVAWQTERDIDRYEQDIHAVRLAFDGTVLDQQPMIIGTHLPNPNGSDDIDPVGPLQVVSNGTDWYVTWWRHNPSIGGGVGTEYFATRVSANGQIPNQQGTLLRTGNQWHVEFGLAFSPVNGGQFLHGYWNNAGSVVLSRFDANMNPIAGSQRTISGTALEDVSIAGSPQGWLVAWEDRTFSRVHAARVDTNGNFIDTTPMLIAQSGQVDLTVGASWNGVNWTVAYSDYAGGGSLDHDIYARRIDPTGPASTALKPAAKLIEAPNHQTNPRLVSSDDGGFKMLYQDTGSTTPGVAVAVLSPTDELLAQRDVSVAAPSHASAEIASDGFNFFTVYASSTAYGTRLLGNRMSPSGASLDAAPLELVPASMKVGTYQVVHFGGQYLVIFSATNGPQGAHIYARSVSSDGEVGPITPVMSTAEFVGFNLDNASVNGDRLILVGNSREGVLNQRMWRFARLFDLNLQPVTERLDLIHGFTLSGKTEAVGDRWLATWAWKSTHNAARAGIAYAWIGRDGTVVGPQTLVSTYPGNGIPTVVSNGREQATEAMVIWVQSKDTVTPQINNEDAIRAQRIAADGTLIGGVFTLIDEPQIQAQLSAAFDGTTYVLSWTDQRNYPYPAQGRDDIFAARVAVDGTVLDPGGFAVADTFRPELGSDVAVAGGRVMFTYRSFRHESPFASYRLAARGMEVTDATPPTSNASAFEFERDQAVSLQFNRPMMGVDASDLIVQNLTTGQTLPAGSFSVQTVPANTQGWTYRWVYGAGILDDGHYRATLPAGSVTDLAGIPNATAIDVNFFFLNADANRDGTVNLADFNILAANFGQSDRTFSQGDFNYDGVVNLADFNLLASRFGQTLIPARGGGTSVSTDRGDSSRVADDVLT